MGVLKEILPLIVFGILLPTADVYSDLALALKLYINGYPIHASVLIAPFLINYVLTWIVWWRMPDKNKHLSWIATALACYPQYLVVKVVWSLCTNMEEGLEKKRVYEREVSELEIFTESVPTTLILTVFIMKSGPGSGVELIFGSSTDWFTYATSVLSASLGMAKCLKVGPCRVLEESGLFTLRFFLLLLSVGFTFVGKGFILAVAIRETTSRRTTTTGELLAIIFLFLASFFIPLFSLCRFKSCQKILKSLFKHPSLALLPVFTYFTFSSGPMCYYSKEEPVKIQWSKRCTLVNMVLSIIGQCLFYAPLLSEDIFEYVAGFLAVLIGIVVIVLGIVLTLLFCFWDSCCCSCAPAMEMSVLLPEDPYKEYVVGVDNELVVVNERKGGQSSS